MKYPILIIMVFALLFASCGTKDIKVQSPNGITEIIISHEQDQLYYAVFFNADTAIRKSALGFQTDDEIKDLRFFDILNTTISTHREDWKMIWGEQDSVHNRYTQLILELQDKQMAERKLDIIFKVYDDGVGFRYQFHKWKEQLIIHHENTEFNLHQNDTCWWIPADYDCYEHLYTRSLLKDIDAAPYLDNGLAASSIKNLHAVSTPFTLKCQNGMYLSIHEANLTNYPGMTLALNTQGDGLVSELVPSPEGYCAKVPLPFNTPWRTIQLSKKAGGLIASALIVNLNEPNRIEDPSWITPMKYIGIWWDMHIGIRTWDYGATQDMTSYQGGKPHGKHGATTEYAKQLIDFASENNIGGVLIEGWNTGWEDWIGDDREGIFDFVTPYPDFDIYEVTRYAKQKGIEIIGHHETSAAVTTYEQQMDTAFTFYKSLGIRAIKTGYVGKIFPEGEYHHGQWMVNHYRRVVEKAAQEKIMINAHEPIKPTGIRRTYPNMLTREGMRGQEFNAWTEGNPPEHLVELPFTRMLGGPLDYTPGIFDVMLNKYNENTRVHSTLSNQLALYVVLYSPLQMAADLIKNYDHPAFEFIRKVPVTWDQTRVLESEIGDYIIIARRSGKEWYLGAITDEFPRIFTISLEFIGDNNTIQIFSDSENTSFHEYPTDIFMDAYTIDEENDLTISMTSGGGFAAIITNQASDNKPIQEFNLQAQKNYNAFIKQRRAGF